MEKIEIHFVHIREHAKEYNSYNPDEASINALFM
jgi:hypothetical protein